MNMSEIETKRRLDLAKVIVDEFSDKVKGIVMAGSVAYSPNTHVRVDSDLDLILVSNDIKSLIPYAFDDYNESFGLHNRVFDGYCVKNEREGVPISLHILSDDAFD